MAFTGQSGARMFETLLTVVIVLAVCWLAFVGYVWIARPDTTSIADATRLLPDTVRLVRRLATDRTIPRRTRWWIWALQIGRAHV